jgi:hypothetical protein
MKGVKGKVSAALRKREAALREGGLSYPEAYEEALLLPLTEPTHYGLGKCGWVTTLRPEGGANVAKKR